MRLLIFANNRIGWQLTKWLRERGEDIVALVVHPPGRRKFGDEIINSAGVTPDRVFDGSKLREPAVLESIRNLCPEIGVSLLFGYVLRRECLEILPRGCVNLHPALLPWNRGVHPNVWSIVDGTPAGATVHFIDEGVDTGDIVGQRAVEVEPVDTGATLYRKLESTSIALFQETWPKIASGCFPRIQQAADAGTVHRVRDLDSIAEIDLDRTYTGRQLIDILRARTFIPYPGAYFRHNGRRIFLRLQLQYEDELEERVDVRADN